MTFLLPNETATWYGHRFQVVALWVDEQAEAIATLRDPRTGRTVEVKLEDIQPDTSTPTTKTFVGEVRFEELDTETSDLRSVA